jgi:hypothetical protein
VGIDISGALISKARRTEQDEPPGICYVHDDVTTPGCLGSRDFDGAACNFGLSDIDGLDAAVTAVSGALRPGGFFAFSILHPCFVGGKGHLRCLADGRQLLRRGALDGAGRPFRAAPAGGRQPPDAVDLLHDAPPPRPVARPARCGALRYATTEDKAEIYAGLNVQLTYNPGKRIVAVRAGIGQACTKGSCPRGT